MNEQNSTVTLFELKFDKDQYKFIASSYEKPVPLQDVGSDWDLFKVYQDHYYF